MSKVTSITVSAPGSVMVCGEHAVVYGHRAMVCAIEQRIQVSIRIRDDRSLSIESHLATHQTELDNLQPHSKLTFVLEAIKAANLETGIDLKIDSTIDPTLGLGSSAAVTAATVAALSLFARPSLDLAEIHRQALAIIHAIQQRGSGADLAASIYGGLIAYQLNPIRIKSLATRLPFQLALHYSGYKTPTAVVLAMVAEKMQSAPEYYQRLYQQMGIVSGQAITAISAANFPLFYDSLTRYQSLLTELGVCDERLAAMLIEANSEAQTLTSKISGSGLGDCILTLYQPQSPLPKHHTPITIASQGLRIEHCA